MNLNNPDPKHITDPMWSLWEKRPNLSWKLGGIYANKPGYHNTVIVNKERWPDNYSIKLEIDLKGPLDKSRAIDYTMSDSEMKKTTARLRDSALDPEDDRLSAVREFYGTLDGKTVYGLSHKGPGGLWLPSSSDLSHLWHIHLSIFGDFCDDWAMLAPIISVLAGEPYEDWKRDEMLIKFGDSGEDVKYWQSLYNVVRETADAKLPAITVDGDYGTATANAFASFVRAGGGQPSYTGQSTPPWFVLRLQQALIIKTAVTSQSPFPEELVREAVADWLTANVGTELTISGTLSGKVQI